MNSMRSVVRRGILASVTMWLMVSFGGQAGLSRSGGDHRPPRVRVDVEKFQRTTFNFGILHGTVNDNERIVEMEIRSRGRSYKRELKDQNFWYQLVDVLPGRNVFRIRATDSAGNKSKLKRVTIFRGGTP